MRIADGAHLHSNQLQTGFALKIAGQIQNQAEQTGKAAVSLIEASDHVAQSAPKAPAADGTGQRVDALA